MASGSFKSNTGSNLEIVAEWTSKADYENNCSEVTVKVYLTHYSIYCGALGGSYIKIGESAHSFSKGVSQSDNTYCKTHIATYGQTVYHDEDGSKKILLSVGWNFSGTYNGYSIGMLEASSTVTLDPIPRASALEVSQRLDIGTEVTFGITSHLSTHKHKAELKLGSKSCVTDFLSGSNPKITVPEDFAEEMPSAREKSGTVTLYTYNGSGALLGSVTKTAVFRVPDKNAFRPDFKLEASPSSDSALVMSEKIYVQGITKAAVKAASQSFKYGAGFGSCVITVGGVRYSASQITSGELAAGAVEIVVKLTDSRGLSVTKRTTVNVLSYHLPFASELSAVRCNESGEPSDIGECFYVYCKAVSSSLGGRNSATLTCKYKRHRAEGGYFEAPLLSEKKVVISAGLAPDASYDVIVTCADAAGGVTEHKTLIPTAVVDMHMRDGSVRFGGYCEKKGFECSWSANFEKGVSIAEEPIADFVTEVGKWGIWTWRKWSSGVSECFGNTGERTFEVTVPFGALYHNVANNLSQPYPEGLFAEPPTVQATLRRVDGAALISPRSTGSRSASPDYYVIYPESKSLTASVDLYCVGRWK